MRWQVGWLAGFNVRVVDIHAWLGAARLGEAWQGEAWQGMAWQGVVGIGVAGSLRGSRPRHPRLARFGGAGQGEARQGKAGHGRDWGGWQASGFGPWAPTLSEAGQGRAP